MPLLNLVTIAMCLPFLSGCIGNGFGLESAAPDPSITTGTSGSEQKTVSDEITVRNAVTSADIGKLEGNAVPWANSFTGSAGTVDQLSELSKDGVVCRDFITTSHSYSGVSKYAGRTCLGADGEWHMVRFEKQG
nr:RT0821/Lpp0805 family surface protein [Rhizobium sp. L1K21]